MGELYSKEKNVGKMAQEGGKNDFKNKTGNKLRRRKACEAVECSFFLGETIE